MKLCDGLFQRASFGSTASCSILSPNTSSPRRVSRRQRHRISDATQPGPRGRARAILDRAVVHIPDVDTDPEYRAFRRSPTRSAFEAASSVPMLRDGAPIGVIMVTRRRAWALLRQRDRAAQDFRRPGGHRHREHTPVQGVGGADRGVDAIGRAVDGAGRGQPRPQLDARRRDGAGHDRVPRASSARGRATGCAISEYDDATELFRRCGPRMASTTTAFDRDASGRCRSARAEGAMGRAAETREPTQIADIAVPGRLPEPASATHSSALRLPGSPLRAAPPRRADHRQPVPGPEGDRRVSVGGRSKS